MKGAGDIVNKQVCNIICISISFTMDMVVIALREKYF